MREEAIRNFGNSMQLLTDLFGGRQNLHWLFFIAQRNNCSSYAEKDMSTCLPTAGRLLCYKFPGQVQPQKGDKAREATTARLTDFSLAPYALGLTSKLSFIQKH